MMLVRFLLCLMLVAGLSACSGSYRAYVDMVKYAFTPIPGAALSYAELQAANHDYVYVRYGELTQAALGLMFIENNQFKWVTADAAMLVTARGRIVKTLGLANNLIHTSNSSNDPLQRQVASGDSWRRYIDWQSGEYGYAVESTFSVVPNQTLIFFSQTIAVTKVVETVKYSTQPDYWRFDTHWQNVFWVDNMTGEVLQSQQQLAPDMPVFQLVFISEVVRHMQRAGLTVAEDAI